MTINEASLVRDELCFPTLVAGDGPPVLLLHGFPDCHLNWEHQLEALAAAGYFAVAPALRGYSPTCQPANGDYSLRAAVEDVCAFADQLGGRVHLVGHDWGAAVGYLASARSPERFDSFTAMAIPPLRRLPAALFKVPQQLWLSGYMDFFQLPLVPEWWLLRDQGAGIERLWRRWSPDWEPGEYLARARTVLQQPGTISAALGWYRHLFRVWTGAHREATSWLKRDIAVSTLVLLGQKDGCMSPRLHGHTLVPSDFPAGVHLEMVDAAGHFLHLERPDEINRLLLEHLASAAN